MKVKEGGGNSFRSELFALHPKPPIFKGLYLFLILKTKFLTNEFIHHKGRWCIVFWSSSLKVWEYLTGERVLYVSALAHWRHVVILAVALTQLEQASEALCTRIQDVLDGRDSLSSFTNNGDISLPSFVAHQLPHSHGAQPFDTYNSPPSPYLRPSQNMQVRVVLMSTFPSRR